jgi:hypothetical protein
MLHWENLIYVEPPATGTVGNGLEELKLELRRLTYMIHDMADQLEETQDNQWEFRWCDSDISLLAPLGLQGWKLSGACTNLHWVLLQRPIRKRK